MSEKGEIQLNLPPQTMRLLTEKQVVADPYNQEILFDNSSLKLKDQFLDFATKDIRDFVVGQFVDLGQFNSALSRAEKSGLPVDYVLYTEGFIVCDHYLAALAQAVDIVFIDPSETPLLQPYAEQIFDNKCSRQNTVIYSFLNTKTLVPWGMGPAHLKQFKHNMSVKGITLSITSPRAVRKSLLSNYQDQLLSSAINNLREKAPLECAYGGPSWAQISGLFALIFSAILGFKFAPVETGFLLSGFFSIVFFVLISFRFAAIFAGSESSQSEMEVRKTLDSDDASLPVYTILVPLFDETSVLKQLVHSLSALDYPKGKLDIKILLEEVDQPTIQMVQSLHLPPYFDVIIVPDMMPRTKPKALNYGLEFARGDYVVIYDAEDIPEPDQLRLAFEHFEKSPSKLSTFQAKLNFYNAEQNWWTKQFTIEYSSLFDWILPLFAKTDLPLPLGGTSNHFKRQILEDTGRWDAYNVTEDADLGMRLYRRGYRCEVLNSTTYEEACSGLKNWLFQRTRWMKGWMQTYYVHMRTPYTLLRELGFWQFIGFQVIIGGPIIAFMVHPIFLMILFTMPYHELPGSLGWAGLWSISLYNLLAGYLATMVLGFMALRKRGFLNLSFALIFVPVYWLMISMAAYRALFQLLTSPFKWEKTQHVGLKKNL